MLGLKSMEMSLEDIFLKITMGDNVNINVKKNESKEAVIEKKASEADAKADEYDKLAEAADSKADEYDKLAEAAEKEGEE